ncbi:hypothetical protein N7460_012983 [Penicillium canescens]|uniref:FAD/NAD(P)-binding domain-containing protein n=1 Tax=Penicillium canescens TaxID=5083 RepID=A0AAD6HZB3_PENCN|nr:hypothetical protein N7460_012983 [Penicillium canescens]
MTKKVAIIGAGPSGLVTAKTLLHNFPQGAFSPVIFDSRHEIGGLWPAGFPASDTKTDGTPGTLDPRMRTNLSRFTVAFSDLAWGSVFPGEDLPLFPRASQVGRYLASYAERYIPRDVLRLGHRVVRTERSVRDQKGLKWTVQWVKESAHGDQTSFDSPDGKVFSEDFDLLVIASGYFAQQYIPDIPGLDQFPGRVIHSSTLHRERDNLTDVTSQGQIVIIGGSMSGVEAASAVALHQSSTALSTEQIHPSAAKVHHIHSRSFWALPTYLPQESEETASFLPLDLAMYDLARRPPGTIEYALGPVSEEKAIQTNSYFQSLLGSDYKRYGHMGFTQDSDKKVQPPWVAIGNDYAEFVRAGTIQAAMGRVVSVQSNHDTKLALVEYILPNGDAVMIDNVAAIVMATGFMPYKSLSLLPEDVLSALEYSTEDPFSPLILDKGGTVRSEIPDVGFVGFYRGPYWGVMEMQARYLGKLWYGQDEAVVCQTADQREGLRSLRRADPHLARGQFPMADYVGLMESFARDLGIERSILSGDSRSGPVVPARYLYGTDTTRSNRDDVLAVPNKEAVRTLDDLQDSLIYHHDAAQKAAASAIFRALHGSWRSTKQSSGLNASGSGGFTGNLTFYPRYPTSPIYDREYLCEENTPIEQATPQERKRFIMRLAETASDTATSRIEIWSVDLADKLSAGVFVQNLELEPLWRERRGEEAVPGEYVIAAKSLGSSSGTWCLYTFWFKGVSISSWRYVEFESGVLGNEGVIS